MKVTFFINYLNHHQVYVADEMYRLLGEDFRYVATMPSDSRQLKGGKDYSSRSYCIMATESEEAHSRALALAENADVCVFGACSQEYAVRRAVSNPEGLSFEMGERWLKRGVLNILSPMLRSWWLNYRRYYHKANFYKLCSGAFVAADDVRLGCYKGRHFKWGYFPTTPDIDFNDINKELENGDVVEILWVGRFIIWKHPEMMIGLAKNLQEKGLRYKITMIGDGGLRPQIEKEAQELNLNIKFEGLLTNMEVQETMWRHHIFCFTSNRLEGWGAVLNEAMGNGCCPVASSEAGSTLFLINDGENGFYFNQKDAGEFHEKVVSLIENPRRLNEMRKKAYKTIHEQWNAVTAADNLYQLSKNLLNGQNPSVIEGPCSKA